MKSLSDKIKKFGIHKTAIVLFLVIFVALYSSDRFMFDFLNKVEERIVTKFNPPSPWYISRGRTMFFKLMDEINIFYNPNKLKNANLTEIKVKLSPDDIEYFTKAVDDAWQFKKAKGGDDVLPESSTKKQKAEAVIGSKKFQIEIGLSGDGRTHWGFYKKSFRLSFTNAEGFDRYQNVLIKVPNDRGFVDSLFSNYLNGLLGLPVVKNEFVKLYINDIFYGIYYMEERYDEKYLEKNGFANSLVLSMDIQKIKRENIPIGEYKFNADYLESLDIDSFSEQDQEEIRSYVSDFYTTIREYDANKLKSSIDPNLASLFGVWRRIMGKQHDVSVANLRIAYNISNGKFFFLPRNESVISPTENILNYDNNLYKFLFEDIDILKSRNEKIKDILRQKEQVLAKYDELYNKYHDFFLLDHFMTIGSREKDFRMAQSRKNLENNLAFLAEYVYLLDEEIDSKEISVVEKIDILQTQLNFGSLNFYKTTDNVFTLPAGTYHLDKDLVLPVGYNFVFSPGVRIFLGEDVSLVSYSPVDIKGQATNRVYIGKKNGIEKFGVFAIQGVDSENCISNIAYLDISGGSEDFVNGVFYSGGLDIYYCDLNLEHSEIHNNYADDGLNVKNGHVYLSSNIFMSNDFDQVDLDYSSGRVENNVFKSGGGTNGDGLDISGSHIIASANSFSDFVDKGISIGEEAIVYLITNKISNSNMAIAVKDLSNAYIGINSFSDNKIDMGLYMKKPIFGGGTAFLEHKDNLVIQKDSLSSINYLEVDDFANRIQEEFYGL